MESNGPIGSRDIIWASKTMLHMHGPHPLFGCTLRMCTRNKSVHRQTSRSSKTPKGDDSVHMEDHPGEEDL